MTREDPRSLDSILRRLKAIEDRQRHYVHHDPSCALLNAPYGACNCWLNDDEETTRKCSGCGGVLHLVQSPGVPDIWMHGLNMALCRPVDEPAVRAQRQITGDDRELRVRQEYENKPTKLTKRRIAEGVVAMMTEVGPDNTMKVCQFRVIPGVMLTSNPPQRQWTCHWNAEDGTGICGASVGDQAMERHALAHFNQGRPS